MIALSKANQIEQEEQKEAEIMKAEGKTVEIEEESEIEKYLGVIVALLSSIAYAICSVFNRRLKEITYYTVMFYHGIIGFIIVSIVVLIDRAAVSGEFRFYSADQYGLLFAAGMFDVLSVNAGTIGY